MYPVVFDSYNKVLSKPINWDENIYGSCNDLPVQLENGICKSCWKLNWGEFFKLLFKRKIYLYVVGGDTQPAVKLLLE